MTLIAMRAEEESAWIVTDAAYYSPDLRNLQNGCNKVRTLPTINTAVITQGDGLFARMFSGFLDTYLPESFDELAADASEPMRAIYDHLITDQPHGSPPMSAVFAVGWSARRSRPRAVMFRSDTGFRPAEVEGLFVYPTPWSHRPSEYELAELEHLYAGNADLPQMLDQRRAAPEVPTPEGLAEIAEIASWVRANQRYDTQPAVVPMLGGAYITHVTADQIIQWRLVKFDDSVETLMPALVGTHHPLAQVWPCHCGSGLAYLDCHLEDGAWRLDDAERAIWQARLNDPTYLVGSELGWAGPAQ